MIGEPKNKHDGTVIAILKKREGLLSLLKLADGQVLKCYNTAWGYDFGDEFAHLTTNSSPFVEDKEIDFFHTSDVVEIADEYGATIYSNKSS